MFVLPAWEHHPGVAYTREVEDKPTVVACVQPKWPVRATELEKRFTERIDRAQKVELENIRLKDEVAFYKQEMEVLQMQQGMLSMTRDALMMAVDDVDVLESAGRAQEAREREKAAQREATEAKRARKEAIEREEAARQELQNVRREIVQQTKTVIALRERSDELRKLAVDANRARDDAALREIEVRRQLDELKKELAKK